MKKIKILHILEATIGGTRTHLNYLVRNLDQEKFEIAVIVSAKRTAAFCQDISAMKRLGIRVFEIDMIRQISLIQDLKSFFKIFFILKKHRFEIIHTHSSKAGVLGRVSAKLTRAPVILYSPHAFAFLGYPNRISHFILRKIEQILGKITTKIICVSESEKQIALENKIGKNKQFVVIQNGIQPNPLNLQRPASPRKTDFSREKIIIGTVGYFRRQKNYPMFLQAAKLVIREKSNVKFLVIGDGEKRCEIQRLLTELDLNTHFILTGHVENVVEYYQMMDIFVLTSFWEGLPYAILEAMAAGVPVVATDVPGTRDIIRHSENGLLVSINNVDLLASTLLSLVENPELRQNIAIKGYSHILNNFNIEKNIKTYDTLYQELYHAI